MENGDEVRRLAVAGVGAAIALVVTCAPMTGPGRPAPVAGTAAVDAGRPPTRDAVAAPLGIPRGFDRIATRAEPSGLELAPTVDIVWLDVEGTRLLLDHTDGVCSEHVATDVVEEGDRVVVTMVDEIERVEPAEPLADGTSPLVVCPMVGILHRSVVELASPLGSRRLIVRTDLVDVPAPDVEPARR